MHPARYSLGPFQSDHAVVSNAKIFVPVIGTSLLNPLLVAHPRRRSRCVGYCAVFSLSNWSFRFRCAPRMLGDLNLLLINERDVFQ
jgi:hypothetical protein